VRVAVLASGGGTNLQALLDTCTGSAPAQVVLVVSNNPKAGALERARRAGVESVVLENPKDGSGLLAVLESHAIDLVVLAGYLKLVPEEVVVAFDGRMLNIHPALLPSFGGKGMYGHHVHEAVLASGATISGPSVHLVSAAYDEGHIVAQWPVPVLLDDTPDSLAARVLEVEHQLLPAVVLAAGRAGRVVRLTSTSERFDAGSGPVAVRDRLGPG
jgi:formyltetrahydrofolate-dependent phosphoribosylglycinamide formyltransferase